jgi:hypothetical protein
MTRYLYYIILFLFLPIGCKKDSDYKPGQNPGVYINNGNPGASARDFLSGSTYSSLKIELQYMPGYCPDDRAVSMFVELLSERLNKPGGISVQKTQINPTLLETFTLSDISNIESRNRTVFTSGDQMSAYILFTSGSYYIGNVAGLTYKNTSVCFFGEALKYVSGGSTPEDKIRIIALLLTHEFGHLLGLVDLGTPMQVDHRDYGNGNHCNDVQCIMHHANTSVTDYWPKITMDYPSFDSHCINDLKANGGK